MQGQMNVITAHLNASVGSKFYVRLFAMEKAGSEIQMGSCNYVLKARSSICPLIRSTQEDKRLRGNLRRKHFSLIHIMDNRRTIFDYRLNQVPSQPLLL